jgi:hypothetical protein
MGKGRITNYVDRGVAAILSLREQCFFWPAEEERQEITSRIKGKHALKNCVGIADGTHLLLSSRPENCGEEYYTRKGQYVVSALIVVEDKNAFVMQL